MKKIFLFNLIFFSLSGYSNNPLEICLDKFKTELEFKKTKKAYAPLPWELDYIRLMEDIVNKDTSPDSYLAEYSRNLKVQEKKILEIAGYHPEWFCPEELIDSRVDLMQEISTWLNNYRFGNKYKSSNDTFGPSISNPFVQFRDHEDWRERGYHYNPNCLDKTKGNLPYRIIDAPGLADFKVLDPACMPDIMFSWASWPQIREWRRIFNGRRKNWIVPFTGKDAADVITNALYLHPSPLATFGYGSFYTARIKLKEGVRFLTHATDEVVGKACLNLPLEETKNTVFVRLFVKDQYTPPATFTKMYQMEFTICSMEVAHSWSYGLPGTYDEQVREYLWVVENWHKPNHLMYRHKAFEPILFLGYYDNKNFTPAVLYQKMQFKLEKILKGDKGEIFFNPGRGIERTVADHFNSKHVLYWNYPVPKIATLPKIRPKGERYRRR